MFQWVGCQLTVRSRGQGWMVREKIVAWFGWRSMGIGWRQGIDWQQVVVGREARDSMAGGKGFSGLLDGDWFGWRWMGLVGDVGLVGDHESASCCW